MHYTPPITAAVPVKRIMLARSGAVLLTQIEAAGLAQYTHAMAVHHPDLGKPLLCEQLIEQGKASMPFNRPFAGLANPAWPRSAAIAPQIYGLIKQTLVKLIPAQALAVLATLVIDSQRCGREL